MAFVPVPNTMKVAMCYKLSGQEMCNVFYVEGSGPPTQAQMEEVAQMYIDAWEDHLKPIQSSVTSLQRVEVRDLSVQNGAGIEYTTGLPQNGASGAGSLPNNCAVAVKKSSGLTGRSFRGRNYFGGMTTAWLDDTNSPNATVRSAIVNFFQQLALQLVADGLQEVVVSTIANGSQRATGVTTPITAYSVNDVLDSQRRRLPERGI
jgi:hypothetical protein